MGVTIGTFLESCVYESVRMDQFVTPTPHPQRSRRNTTGAARVSGYARGIATASYSTRYNLECILIL